MKAIKRIMAGLDFSKADISVLSFVEYFSKIYHPEKTYLINVLSDFDVPDEVLEKYPELKKSVEASAIEKLKSEVKLFAPSLPKTEIIYDVEDGKPLDEFLKIVTGNDIDLVIAGRKNDLNDSNLMHGKLSRKVQSNLLLVPQHSNLTISTILVTSDFSENSKLAVEAAIDLAKVTGAAIKCLHLYKVPVGYYKTGKSFEEFALIMKAHAEEKFASFIKGFDSGNVTITPDFICDSEDEFGKLVNDFAEANKIDLIVIGARGRTETAAVFLGSSTEELINADSNIPLLIIKNKAQEFGFWEAFQKLM